MKPRPRAMVAAAAISIALGACGDRSGGEARAAGTATPWAGGSGATVGSLGGTAGGGLAGPQPRRGSGSAPALSSTLAGDLGNRLGNGFDEDARLAAAQAERQALSTNQPVTWTDPEAGASGRVRPLRSFTDAAGRECREYVHTVIIPGRRETGTGIACRQSDGSWMLLGS